MHVALLAPTPYNRDMLEPGSAAPNFDVQDHTGTLCRLSDFKGKILVLWFYPKADTPG